MSLVLYKRQDGREKASTSGRTAWMALLALAALGTMMLLALQPTPAWAATTFTVTRPGDEGDINLSNARCDASNDSGDQCTLRAAIEEANDTDGDDTIDFDIGSDTGVKTISPDVPLPPITDTVIVNGYSQPGARPNTLEEGNDADLKVQLDGTGTETDPSGIGEVSGIVIRAPDSVIKGLVIKKFDDYGVHISGIGSDEVTGNRIEGNFIGTNADGTADRGNVEDGVLIAQGANNNTIGGPRPGRRNVISGNGDEGISIFSDATGNRVEGNHVGTTADGTGDLGNDGVGVLVYAAEDNTIGGTVAGKRNVISGNESSGVEIFADAKDNWIEGNFIGTTADGSGNLGNAEDGVTLFGSDFAVVGGTAEGAGNRIAHNGDDGVSILLDYQEGNQILSNSIYENGEQGIDLGNDGVTQNDPGDVDSGANGLQNFPRLLSATRDSATGDTTISGELRSNPGQDFAVQCFLTDGTHGSGHGEGLLLLETTVASTSANGRVNFSCVGSSPTSGQTVTATATNVLTGDTSEFSRNSTVTTVP
jgi:hypothetical protein